MGVTAKQRVTYGARGTTTLSPERVLDIVAAVAEDAKGAGASVLTTGLVNVGARIKVVRRTDSRVTMALNSAKNLVEMGTFSGEATAGSEGRTTVRVGGLDSYKTTQQKALFFIPVGPKQVWGMSLFKSYVDAVAAKIRAEDPGAQITVGQST